VWCIKIIQLLTIHASENLRISNVCYAKTIIQSIRKVA
jgi:hypothetical protein